MVSRILKLFSREISGLHEAAYLLAFFSFFSQVLALVRDRLLAHNFGADHSLDLYYAAFRVPDFIFVSVGSIVSISVLIPFFMEKMDKGHEDGKKYIDNLFTAFFFIIGAASLVGYVAMPFLIRVIFPEFQNDTEALVKLSRILLLSPIFLGFSNFLASITQIYKRYFIYALSPVFYNVGIIFGILFLSNKIGIYGLVWGVVIGAIAHLGTQVPFIISKKLFPSIYLPVDWTAVRHIATISLPRTITISSNELAKIFLISFASLLSAGSISIFSFSYNLQSVPLSIIGVSYSLAAFPILIKFFSRGEEEKFVQQMITTSKHIIFWTVPISVLFIVLRAQIVRVLLGSGSFNWTDTRLTAAALALFSLSLTAQCLTMLFVRAYYSRNNTWRPLLMNIISASIIVFSTWFFVKIYEHYSLFRHFFESSLKISDVVPATVVMLPFGFSFGSIANMVIHWVAFHKDFGSLYTTKLLKTFSEVFLASLVMGFTAYNLLNILDNVLNINTFLGIFAQGFLSGIIGILFGLLVLILLGNAEVRDIWAVLHRRIWGVPIVGPDSEL